MAARLGPGRAGAFHARRRGEKVRLSKKNSVAERVSSFHDGVVFSAQPIALDTLYSVELLEKDKWSGGLGFGVTTRSPEDHHPVPDCFTPLFLSGEYWVLQSYIGGEEGVVQHHRQKRDMGQDFDREVLKVGQSAGFVVTKDGDLRFRVNSNEGVGWTGLPTDKPLWGIFDVFGLAKSIKLSVFAPLQKAVQPKPPASPREEWVIPRSKQPPPQVGSQAHTRIIEDLMQENARLKQQIQQQSQDHKLQLDQAQASHQQTVQQLEHQLLQANRDVEQLRRAQQEASAHDIEPWKVARAKVELGDEIARGGWGSVSEGKVRVAVKQLHMAIANERNIQRLRREMRILSQIRHPNLVQFIGAVFDEQAERLLAPPLIITELLDTNLRSAYERNRLSGSQKLSIFKDIAKALKYLHERHDPIIHRDVSAPNVLLEALPGGNWKGKLTDLGSANFARVAQTLAEGAIIYAAPETFPTAVANPDAPPPPQTFKIDVYSFGVMLCEVTTSRFPDQNEYGDMLHQVQRTCPPMYSLIQSCTKANQDQRPVMTDVLRLLGNVRALP